MHVTKSTTMPRPRTKRLGEGAMCSVLLKLLRPSREVAERFPNATAQQRLDDLIATRLGRVDRRGNNFEAVFFTSATFPGLELSCAWGKYPIPPPWRPHVFGWFLPVVCCLAAAQGHAVFYFFIFLLIHLTVEAMSWLSSARSAPVARPPKSSPHR